MKNLKKTRLELRISDIPEEIGRASCRERV